MSMDETAFRNPATCGRNAEARALAGRGRGMMARTHERTCPPATHFFLAQGHGVAYNCTQQHPPRLSTMRTMGGYFFPGTEQ